MNNFRYEEVLPQKYGTEKDFELLRQEYLNEVNMLKQNGTLVTPDVTDEKVKMAVFYLVYNYFYDKAIEQNMDKHITVYTEEGEKTFSLLEALTYIKFANKW